MNPYIESFLRKIHFHHHRFFKGRKSRIMTYHKCIKNFIIYRGAGFARGKINLGTLDILELQGRLQGKEERVNRRIIDKKISSISQRNEFRSFFFFLEKEFPGSYEHMPFIKSERPDFLLRYKNQVMGIEVTEAIDAGDARLRGRVYESDFRGRKSREIERYVDQNPTFSSEKAKSSLEKLIVKRIMDKKEKFEEFQSADREILIIIANHHEFRNPGDIERVRKALEKNDLLEKAPFSLVVMNMIHGAYAHFRWAKGGAVLEKNLGSKKETFRAPRGKSL